MKTTIKNKSLVLEFWKKAIGERDLQVADKLISENYIQHSPGAKPGKAGLMEALTQLQKMPRPQAEVKPLMRIIAEGNFVAVHMLIEFGGRKMLVLDLVRIENGQFAEHWDTVEPVSESVQNPLALTNGPIQIEDEELTDNNRGVVLNYRESLLKGESPGALGNFVDRHIIHHSPELEDWQKGETGLVIAEGNFVLTQTKIRMAAASPPKLSAGAASAMVYDIYRLKHGKIHEHWQVRGLPIPG